MSKKILSIVLVVLMVAATLSFVGCNQVKNENKVIVGSTTDLSGDFRFPGWGGSSAGASDQAVTV